MRPLRLICISFVAVLAVTATAIAHSGAGADYKSVVMSISPDGLPITADVVDGDDRLRLSNTGDKDLIVLGYRKEPYAKIGPDGTFVNHRSSAYYINSSRYGDKEKVPKGLDVGAPEWVQEDADLPVFEFHDHRIHWMARTPPESVDVENPKEQKVYDWTVEARYGTTPVTITGRLTYVGGQSSSFLSDSWPWLAVGGAGLVAIVAIVVFILRRRQEHHS